MSKVKTIPYVYGKADRTLVDKIERDRPCTDGIFADWWMVGKVAVTMLDNGYYHCYVLESDPFNGKVIRDYRLSRNGKLVDTERYYSVPTKEEAVRWYTERGLNVE